MSYWGGLPDYIEFWPLNKSHRFFLWTEEKEDSTDRTQRRQLQDAIADLINCEEVLGQALYRELRDLEADALRTLEDLTRNRDFDVNLLPTVDSLRGAIDRARELQMYYAAQRSAMEALHIEICNHRKPRWTWPLTQDYEP
jgi:hypothetical protein